MKKIGLLISCCLFWVTGIFAQADLALELNVDQPMAPMGTRVTFTIKVTNSGPSDATGIEVSNTIPAGYTSVTYVAGPTVVDRTNGIWMIGGLKSGAVTSLLVSAVISNRSNSMFLSEVTGSNQADPDSTPANGVDTDSDGQVVDDPDDEDDGDGQDIRSLVGGAGTGYCLAPADEVSSMQDNPTDPSGTFKFDYWIESEVEVQAEGIVQPLKVNYYINTSDGSMYFPKGFLMANRLPASSADGEIHGALWMPNGQMARYVYDSENDIKRVIVVDTEQTASDVIADKYMSATHFMASTRNMKANPEPLPTNINLSWGPTKGYLGELFNNDGTKSETTIYFAEEPNILPIKTNTPLVGFLVGIFKDNVITNCNRLAIYSKMRVGSDYIQGVLRSIKPRSMTFNGEDYKIMKMEGVAGTKHRNSMKDYENLIIAKEQQIDAAYSALNRCAFDPCRRKMEARVKKLEKDKLRLQCKAYKLAGVEDSMEECAQFN